MADFRFEVREHDPGQYVVYLNEGDWPRLVYRAKDYDEAAAWIDSQSATFPPYLHLKDDDV